MTTPRQYNDTTHPNLIPQDQAIPQDRTVPPGQQIPYEQPLQSMRPTEEPPAPADQRIDPDTPQSAAPAGRAGQTSTPLDAANESGRGDALFAEHDMADLRTRWNDVQAGFVDDPRECVQRADGLVSSAVEHLTANFAHTRSRLEEQWSRGEEASTEDLRIALKRYRDFFDRLLAV